MDCFYIITNKLKDPDFAITNEIKRYIESKGKVCYISEKDSEGHIIPGMQYVIWERTVCRSLGSTWEHWGI